MTAQPLSMSDSSRRSFHTSCTIPMNGRDIAGQLNWMQMPKGQLHLKNEV